jgi:hypothetical protein
MTRLADPRAILGIDPTSRGLAFAYFEGSRLLDWGTRRVLGDDLAALDRILDLCPADVLVVEDVDAPGCARSARVRSVLRQIEQHARIRGLVVTSVSRAAVRAEWLTRGASNKFGVATAIAELFPVLDMILPRIRKPYRSEVARTDVFDAASLVLHVFGNGEGPVGASGAH